MASARALARLQSLIWVLIYGGLFALVLGIAGLRTVGDAPWAWTCVTLGPGVAVVGALLIWVRSRLRESASDGTPSP